MQSVNSTKQEKKPLSVKGIEAMKPDQIKADTGENAGLRVKCAKSGVKAFFYRYTSPITGKLIQVPIGHFPDTTLNQARIKLHELKVIRKSGRCPATEKKQLERGLAESMQLAESTNNFTIEAMIELYLTKNIEDRVVDGKTIAGARQLKGQIETRRTLMRGVVDHIGAQISSKVTRKEIISLIMKKVEIEKPVQAGNILRELSAAYEYAIGLDYYDDYFVNPAILAKASLRQAKVRLTAKRGVRFLTNEEIKKLLEWLPGSAYTPTQKNILRLTLWTGCRTGEVCYAEWRDINLETGIWRLRSSKTKTGVERDVQLSTQAVSFLTQLKLITGDYLFPSLKTGKPIQQKSLTEQSWLLLKSNRMLDIDKWTPHDLRRTVRSGLSKLGCRSVVAEAILGHSRKGIEGTYDLHNYEDECREWLQTWADHLDKLLSK